MKKTHTEFYNFLFEVEGEFPIFVAIATSERNSFLKMRHMAKRKAISIYEVPVSEIRYLGAFTDEEAEELGYDTF